MGSTNVSVINGTVNVSKIQNGTIIGTIQVKENESVFVDPETNETLTTGPFVRDKWILQNILEDEELYDQLKTDLYTRLEPYIPNLKERYGMTDEELDVLIDGYLKGQFDLPPETPQWIRDIIDIY